MKALRTLPNWLARKDYPARIAAARAIILGLLSDRSNRAFELWRGLAREFLKNEDGIERREREHRTNGATHG